MRIHKAYPNININWLLYGEDTMEKVFPQPENVDLFSQLPSDVNDGNAQSAYKVNKEGYLVKKMEYRSKEMPREEIKYIEKPQPKITEIRIFFDNGTIVSNLTRAAEYARLLSSIRINAVVVNNVNANYTTLRSDNIEGLSRIADVFRPYGVQLGMSLYFGTTPCSS